MSVSPNIGSFHMYQYESIRYCGSVCSMAGFQPLPTMYATCLRISSLLMAGR